MSPGSFLFAVCSILCIAGALIVVLARNPIRGAMGLLTTIVGIAGLFLRLNAQFLAAMQLLVYAGAVVILFVFVVMLLGPNARSSHQNERISAPARLIAALSMGAVGVGSLTFFAVEEPSRFALVDAAHGSVTAVGRQIFTEGLVPFELATVLLIVAVVGAIAVARSKPNAAKTKEMSNPTLRMFSGPLHPRDAERPLPPGPLVAPVNEGVSAGKESA